MPRIYRHVILAAIGAVALTASSYGSEREQVNASSKRSAEQQHGTAADSSLNAGIANREREVQPDCGTPKDCRAEKREQDNLEAAQTSAKAAVGQRSAAWWQAGIGAAGVILLIMTVIYSHKATKAAIDSVNVVALVEGARIAIGEHAGVINTDGAITTFKMLLSNNGRTMAVIEELCLELSNDGLFTSFSAMNKRVLNAAISAGQTATMQTLMFNTKLPETRFITGYYKFSTVFSKKLITDYFCFQLFDPMSFPNEEGKVVGIVPTTLRMDLGWPADESWNHS